MTGPISSPVTFGIWGDMGASNAQILDYVKEEVDEGNFDMILHVGGETRLERRDGSIPPITDH